MKILVNKIIPFSSVDGEGNRFVIFLQECNFDCLYCHNPETINLCNNCKDCIVYCPRGALSFNKRIIYDEAKCIDCDSCIKNCSNNSSPKTKEMTIESIVNEIEKVKFFISGVTVSGGECTLQRKFLIELSKKVHNLGLNIYIDTNGNIPLYEDDKLCSNIDKFMLDVKSFNSIEHKYLTGKDNKVVLKNLEYLLIKDKLHEVRTVIVPDILDNESNVFNISSIIGRINPNIRYKLIKYRDLGVRKDKVKSYTPTDEYMNKLIDKAKENKCINVISSL